MRRQTSAAAGRIGIAVTALLLYVAGVVPAAAQDDGGSVTAEVTISEALEACLLLSVDSIGFGVLDFEATDASEPYTVSSCSTGGQQLFASATDAATDDPDPDTWDLTDGDEQLELNQFVVDTELAGIGEAWLATDPTLIGALSAQASAEATHQLIMPPDGSAGAGQTFSFDIVWTAVVDDAEPTWTPQASGTTDDLLGVSFVDSDAGWAVGTLAGLASTVDGGTSWSLRGNDLGMTLEAVDFIDTSRGWVAGGSRVRATFDGGANWVTSVFVDAVSLRDLAFVSADVGWAVSQSGRIWRTGDGGVGWLQQHDDANQLWGVTFLDENTGWAVGDDVILRTTNGGADWARVTTSSFLIDVEFVDAQRGWAVGLEGAILATTDGGVSWTAQDSNADEQNLRGVGFVDASTGWAVGQSGTIRRTTDGGLNWEVQDSGTTQTLRDIAVVDASNVWIVGDGGTILTLE